VTEPIETTFPCPHCGGKIMVKFVQFGVQSDVQNSANPEIAPDLTDFELELQDQSPKGKGPYNQGYTQDFLAFWSVYPRKRAKGVAYKAWSNAVKRLVQIYANRPSAIGAILDGAERYRDDPNRQDEFTQHAATWLNGDGWEDEPLPTRIDRRREESDYQRTERLNAEAERWFEEHPDWQPRGPE